MKGKMVEYLTKGIEGLEAYRDSIEKQIESVNIEVAKMAHAIDEISSKVKELKSMLEWVKKQ